MIVLYEAPVGDETAQKQLMPPNFVLACNQSLYFHGRCLRRLDDEGLLIFILLPRAPFRDDGDNQCGSEFRLSQKRFAF